jgi:hypothetical protein
MAAHDNVSGHQFGKMHEKLQEGGFTYDPNKRDFPKSGWVVAAHPEAELRVPAGHATTDVIHGYVAGSAPTWKGKGETTVGGWQSEAGQDVLDIGKRHPATPAGQTESRRAQIRGRQEAGYGLHKPWEEAEDVNPFIGQHGPPTPGEVPHPSRAMPEFSKLVENRPEVALQQPEIQAWTESPQRKVAMRRKA